MTYSLEQAVQEADLRSKDPQFKQAVAFFGSERNLTEAVAKNKPVLFMGGAADLAAKDDTEVKSGAMTAQAKSAEMQRQAQMALDITDRRFGGDMDAYKARLTELARDPANQKQDFESVLTRLKSGEIPARGAPQMTNAPQAPVAAQATSPAPAANSPLAVSVPLSDLTKDEVKLSPDGMKDLQSRIDKKGGRLSPDDRLAITVVISTAQERGNADAIDAAWKLAKDNRMMVPVKSADGSIVGTNVNGVAIEEAKSRWNISPSGNLISRQEKISAAPESNNSGFVAARPNSEEFLQRQHPEIFRGPQAGNVLATMDPIKFWQESQRAVLDVLRTAVGTVGPMIASLPNMPAPEREPLPTGINPNPVPKTVTPIMS